MTLVILDAIPLQFAAACYAWRTALVSIIVTLGYLYYRWRLAEPMSGVPLLSGVLWMMYGVLATLVLD